MELSTFQYHQNTAWSINSFPDLDSDNTLILIFASPNFIDHPQPLLDLIKKYPKSKIIGCSTAGEIAGSYIFDNSLSVALMRFEKTTINIVSKEITHPEQSMQVGENIAKKLQEKELRSIFVLSDGLNVNGSELVKGLNQAAKKDIVITGGLAGDGSRFQETWAIVNGKIQKNTVVGVGFSGKHFHIQHGSKGGWNIFGPERCITRSKGNIVYELDHKPALALYKEYLGDEAKNLPASGLLFPLSIRKNQAGSNQLVRTILAVNEEEQSLTFAGDMPMGYLAQLMRSNFDRLIQGAEDAAALAASDIENGENPVLTIAISCVGRRLLLGERTEEEIQSTLEAFPSKTQQIGFYSYGEISPYSNGPCDLHNQTMTLTSIFEKIQ